VPIVGADRYAETRVRRGELEARAGVDAPAMERLLRRYGDRVHELLVLIEERPELAEPLEGGGGHLAAEVVHACAHEGALRLEDVLARRTRLAINTADRGVEAAEPAAALIAPVLEWSTERAACEVEGWRRRVAAERAGEAEPDDERALRAYRDVLAPAKAER
jgi:glycerol-3-phosphate dehydrogenase